MLIKFLPPDYIINAVRKIELEGLLESDFLLRAIRIRNTTKTPIKIIRYVFDLKIKGTSQQQVGYSGDVLKERALALGQFAEQFLKEREGPSEIFRNGALHTQIGTDNFWDKDHLTTDVTLEPDQETGFLNEHFRIKTTTSDPIDELVFAIYYTQNGKEKKTQITIPVIQYKNKNQYIFPVKGVWHVTMNWDGPDSHRGAYSQEFAFDLEQLDKNLQIMLAQKRPNDEYACYGKEVIAIADGDVVDCFDQYPENPSSCSDLIREEVIEFGQKYGYLRTGGGNQVVLKHADGEYSFYAHLIPDSLKVKQGDSVKQGQVLGRVGNSGHSDGPHLHFQLMDGPNKLTARGLPCHFANIKTHHGTKAKFIERDQSIIHTT